MAELRGPALVTGGGGFLGKAIVRRLLDRGIQVRSLARSDYPELREWGAETVRGSVADSEAVIQAVQGCQVVFHVAAKVGTSMKREGFVRTNIEGTQAIIDACREHGVPKLVYTSTPSVIHAGGDLEGVDESLPYPEHFDAHYPETKAEAERRVLAASKRLRSDESVPMARSRSTATLRRLVGPSSSCRDSPSCESASLAAATDETTGFSARWTWAPTAINKPAAITRPATPANTKAMRS